MASVEFLKGRVESLKVKLVKLENKLVRIQKAKDSGWENNPYCYGEDAFQKTNKEIEKAKKSLARHEHDLQIAIEKEGSRNIQMILYFLDNWKTEVRDYLYKLLETYSEEYDKTSKECDDYMHNLLSNKHLSDSEKYSYERDFWSSFNTKYKPIDDYYDVWKHDKDAAYSKIEKALQLEADRRYDEIVKKINHIVGKIISVRYLYIDEEGYLNGYVDGTRGSVSVNTIGVGDNNTRCFHYRTYVRSIC